MADPARKHGGRRNPPGGRPAGSTNALRYGEVKALRVAKLRVPDSATPEAATLADTMQERIISVAMGKVNAFQAGHVLKAACYLREEVCGPQAQKVDVSGQLQVSVNIQGIDRGEGDGS